MPGLHHSQRATPCRRRTALSDAEAALARLAVIEQAVAALDMRLRELEARREASAGEAGDGAP
jgi:hypothetical protein